MVILFWNPIRNSILKILPVGQTMNGDTFLQSIIEPLCEYPQFKEAKKSRKKFYIHFDNCPSYKKSNVIQFLNEKKMVIDN